MWKIAPLIAMTILPAIQAVVFVWDGNFPLAGLVIGFAIANASTAYVAMHS